jgi:hypothetical protein
MRYEIKLSEQEELYLQQITMHPGYPVLLKLLQMEKWDAVAEAMACKDLSIEKRALALTDAQRTDVVVGNITQRLERFRESSMPSIQPEPENAQHDPLLAALFSERNTH